MENRVFFSVANGDNQMKPCTIGVNDQAYHITAATAQSCLQQASYIVGALIVHLQQQRFLPPELICRTFLRRQLLVQR